MTGKVKFVQQKGGLLPEYRDDEPSTPQTNAGSSSSIPLTNTQSYTDFPVESLEALPAYTDSPLPVLYPASSLVNNPSIATIPESVLSSDEITTITHYAPFSTDSQALHDFILQQNEIPPKPVIRLIGQHHESRRKSDGKDERVTITDFDIKLDLSPYIARSLTFQPGTPNSVPDNADWKFLTVAENDTKTFRGTRTKCRDKAFGLGTYAAPHLGNWTKAYCEDLHAVKSFTFKKEVTDMNREHLNSLLRNLVEQTHYLGHLQIKHYTTHSKISIYSPHWINRWRTKWWIRWLFYLSFLWIFTWPTIWFMERRYEVVTSVWPYSLTDPATGAKRYAVASEDAWFKRYRNAIRQAIFARRQGDVGEADVMMCDGTDDDGAGTIRIGDGSGFNPGGITGMIGAVGGGGGGVLGMTRGLLGAGVVGASRGLDAIRGWGGDTDGSWLRGSMRYPRTQPTAIQSNEDLVDENGQVRNSANGTTSRR